MCVRVGVYVRARAYGTTNLQYPNTHCPLVQLKERDSVCVCTEGRIELLFDPGIRYTYKNWEKDSDVIVE